MSAFSLLKNELLRLDREQHHLDFLTTCRDVGLIPKFLTSRSKFMSMSFPRQKFEFEYKCLKATIRIKHALILSISKRIYGVKNNGLYHAFAVFAASGTYDHSMRVIERYRETQRKTLEARHLKKINHLSGDLNPQPTVDRKTDSFLNLSRHQFTEEQTILLNRGPKYISNIQPRPIDLLPQLEDIVRKVPPCKREEIRCRIFLSYSRHLKRNVSTNQDRSVLRSLKSIPDIVYLATDKSNRLAILEKQEYLLKMERTIQDMDCDLITNDPLPSLTYKTNKIVKCFKSSVWPDEVRKMMKINQLGVIPKLFAVLKDHKPNHPLRPIVSRCAATTYFLEKTLVLILKKFLPPSEYVLTSTTQFIERIQQLALPASFFMFSLDIVALYPSVNMPKARDNLSQILLNSPNITDDMRNNIISAVNLVINSNFFVFNGQIYRQKTGAPMGSPISGIMAEFILRPLEQSFLSTATIQPIGWMRYVDDIFAIWPSTRVDFQEFFDAINQLDPAIKFTKELEVSRKLPFLDVLLTNENGVITRSVYRKSCNSLSTIPKPAHAPRNYKEAAYKSYIRRALVVCTPDLIHEEFNIIRRIAVDNGYSIHFVDDLIKKVTRGLQRPPSNTTPTRVPLQYMQGFHEKINNIVRPYGIHIIACTSLKLSDFLRTNLDSVADFQKAGVYEIPMLHQDNSITFYIGQTTRKLQVRIMEHKNDVRKAKQTSAIFRALQEDPSITVKFEDAKIVAPFTTNSRTLLRESLEIFTRMKEVCNDQDSCAVPKIWLSILQ